MSSEAGSSASNSEIGSSVRGAVGRRDLAMLFAGVLAGAGLGVLDETLAVPFVGPTPGLLVGAVCVAVAVGVYRRNGCDDCGERACGCAGDCGDSCSREG